MAIMTEKATILMRRGLRQNFDPDQMTAGEWAVSIDTVKENQIVWMCFAPGMVKRMGTYEDFYTQIEEAMSDIRDQYIDIFDALKDQYIIVFNNIKNEAKVYSDNALAYADAALRQAENAKNHADAAAKSQTAAAGSSSQAAQSAGAAENYSKESESHSHGGTGTRPGEDTDNSLYYSQLSRLEYERAKEEADRAEKFSGFVKPQFLLLNNRLYLKRGSTVEFIAANNRMYYKIGA